ncbi:MAG: serine/threonine protein kinase, partial [Terriglobales bacterium]
YVQGQDFVKVLDFGIADQSGAEKSGIKRAKMAAGSPAYMSPEQCQGFELDQRSDVYSLGIVVYEMLTGERPFAAEDVMALFRQHVSQPPQPMSSVRADLKFNPPTEAVIAKALAKKPQNRQQSIKEFQRELEEASKVGDAATASKRVESVTLDLWSVPMGESLTESGPSSLSGNFLPGPEDWMENEQHPHPDSLAPVAKAASPAGKPAGNNSPSSGTTDAELQAKVNRLLKSAKKASASTSTALPLFNEPIREEPSAPDVSSWAKEVLTRTPDAIKPAAGGAAPPSIPVAPAAPAQKVEPPKPPAPAAKPAVPPQSVPAKPEPAKPAAPPPAPAVKSEPPKPATPAPAAPVMKTEPPAKPAVPPAPVMKTEPPAKPAAPAPPAAVPAQPPVRPVAPQAVPPPKPAEPVAKSPDAEKTPAPPAQPPQPKAPSADSQSPEPKGYS